MSNIHFIELETYKAPKAIESKRDNWVEYGEDNNYYQFLIDRYNTSTTNNAIVNSICKLIYGKGLEAKDASRKPNAYAQMKMLFQKGVLKKAIVDLKLLGNMAFQVIYSKDKKSIVKIEHIPVHLLRAEKCNEKGEITGYYYSNDWTDTRKFVPVHIPAFGFGDKTLEILFVNPYTVGQKYYANVDYIGAIPYTKLEEEIADYLINEVQNGFSGTKVVNFNNGETDEEKQSLISNKVKSTLTGSTGKKVIVAFNDDETHKTTVDNIPLDDAPSHYEYLSNEARSKIMLGHNVTSPLIFGIATATGFSANADELKNSFVLFNNMVVVPFQEVVLDAIDKILAYNKISLNIYFDQLQVLDAGGELEIEESGSDTQLSKINLEEYGEDLDANQWELIDSRPVDYDSEDALDAELAALNNPKKTLLSKVWNFVTTGVARPNAPSEQDSLFFVTRYRYSGEAKENSRPFCKRMLALNKLYRKEDILQMGDKASTNPGWGPEGSDTYSIWMYKGGGNCHHFWTRETYRKRQYLSPSTNSGQLTPAQVRKEGEIVPTNDKIVYTKPIDMPNQGFLPTNIK